MTPIVKNNLLGPGPSHPHATVKMQHIRSTKIVFPAKLQPENYKKSCIQGTSQESYLHISIMTIVYFTQLIQTYLNGKVVSTHAMKAYSRNLAPVNLNLGTR